MGLPDAAGTLIGIQAKSWLHGVRALILSTPGTARSNVATMITEECINCGICVPECPNDAIHMGAEIYTIDQARCTECVGFHDAEQCAAVCPVDCCVSDPDNVEDELVLFSRAQAIHPDRAEQLELTAETSRFRRS